MQNKLFYHWMNEGDAALTTKFVEILFRAGVFIIIAFICLKKNKNKKMLPRPSNTRFITHTSEDLKHHKLVRKTATHATLKRHVTSLNQQCSSQGKPWGQDVAANNVKPPRRSGLTWSQPGRPKQTSFSFSLAKKSCCSSGAKDWRMSGVQGTRTSQRSPTGNRRLQKLGEWDNISAQRTANSR